MNEGSAKVSMWNPGAIANWSILFSPIFGGWLMSSNWKEIGDEKKAKSSMLWVYAGIALIVITLILNFFVLPEGKSANGLFLLYFVAWRFTSAKSQLIYVKNNLPDGYTKKGFIKPISIAISILFVYVALVLGVATAFTSSLPETQQIDTDYN